MANKSGVSAQATSLPAGGGDIRGLGESFQPDLNTGTGQYRIGLELPAGVRQFQPSLALVYSTGAGNGPFGQGWSLPVPTISRRAFRGVPHYDARDVFLYNTGELIEVAPGRFRPAVENGFERFERTATGWIVTDRSGTRHRFGSSAAGRIEVDDGGTARTFSWLLERSEDLFGNAIEYGYVQDGAQAYLSEVRYAIYRVAFEYEPRPDVLSDFRVGFELRTALRCRRITLHSAPVGPGPVRSWRLEYRQAALAETSLLARVTQTGHDPAGGETASLPALELSYTEIVPAARNLTRFSSLGAPPPPLHETNADLLDFDGRALPGVVSLENGGVTYWSNAGNNRWAPPRSLPRLPAAVSLGEDRVRLADMDGDGGTDILVGRGPFSAYYVNSGRGGWEGVNHYARSPSLLFDENDLHLVDIDGDGLVDAVHSGRTGLQVHANRGRAGWDPPRLLQRGDPEREPPDITTADPRVRLADMNGDGLLDVVHIASGRLEYWPARGNGRYEPGRSMANPPAFPYPFDPERVLLADVNGDGLTDVVYVAFDEIVYWINRSGRSFSPPQRIRCTPPTGAIGNLRIADMRGIGAAGLLWTGPQTDYRFLSFVGDVKPGLLNRIDNQLGRVVDIEYSNSPAMALADADEDQPWASFLPFPLQVVASVTVTDSTRGTRIQTQYRYHEGHYDGARRELDGFARAEQLEIGDSSQPTARTVHFFHTEASARLLVADAEARRTLKRKLHRVEVYGLDGSEAEDRPYRIEESVWAVRTEQTTADGRRVLFPFVAETSVLTSERAADGTGRLERRQFLFDGHGNVVDEVRTGRLGSASPALYTRTQIEYALDESAWVLDRAARMVVRDEAGSLLSETRLHYDGPDFVGLPLGQVTRGQLARKERVALHVAQASAIFGSSPPDFAALAYTLGNDVDGAPAWLVQQERRRTDARGNVTAKQDARGNLTSYTFDGFGLFATEIEEPNGLAGTVSHDYAVGKPVRFENPNGGVSEARYDPLGRLAVVAAPGDSLASATTRFFYDTEALPAVRRTEQRVGSGPAELLHVFEYLDGAGAVFQRRSQHATGVYVVSGHELGNARGKTARKFDPFFEAGEAFTPYVHGPDDPHRAFFYDSLGRPTETRMPTGGRSRVVQEAGRALFHDAGDNDPSAPSFATPRIERYDAWQRLIAVDQPSGPGSVTTSYALDPLGRLAQVTDARDLVLTRIDHDLLGRRVRIRHADAGARLLIHDAAGNLVETVDADGRRASYAHDGLNRLTEVRHDGTVVERMTYDTGPGANVRSRLATVEDAVGKATYGYDARGNAVRQTRTLTGETGERAIELAYDGAARVQRLTYPDGVSVDFDYGSGFLLKAVPGYVDAIDYEPTGVRKAVHYANGIRTDYRFDPATSRLRELETWHPASGQVHHHIRYDVTIGGNVDAISDLRAGGGPGLDRSQSFVYDAFDRLTQATGSDGAGPYTHQYAYDEVDNLTRNPLLGPGTLVYAPGTNRLIGAEQGGLTTTLFGYDASGNMTSMPGRALTYNARQQLERVTLAGGTEVRYRYDHRGILGRKDVLPGGGGPSVRTVHFGNLFDLEGSTATRWVFAGDLPVAFERGGTRVFIHGDQLQSAAVFTDAAGALLGEAAHYPFGAVAKAPAAGLEALFAKRRQDPDTGLVYMGARWYAPDVGRFISPDPLYLLKPEDGAQEPRRLNPYAYAGNNPLRYVDPSGLGFWDVLATVVIVAAIVAAAIIFAPAALAALGALSLSTVLFVGGGLMLGGALVGAIAGGLIYGSWEGALRGAMIGFVAGANAFIGGVLFGPLVGAALGIIGFLSLFPPIAQSDVYQGILGWSSYFMPMSWPGHAIGLVLFVINVAPMIVMLGQVDSVRIKDIVIDWKTGNIFSVGGWVGNAPPRAFNMGGFSFVNESRYVNGEIIAATFEHESGHMLNNAAFGIFQATVVFTGGAADTYWERLAESNVPDGLRGTDPVAPEPDRPSLPQWG